VKVVGDDGTGTPNDLAAGIEWALANGADVINVSLVFEVADAAVEAALAEARAHNVVVVAAAGNGGSREPVYPAASSGVLGVVALDHRAVPYVWSSRGTWATYGAPGCTIVASTSNQPTSFCGTSAAAAVVSGLAGLLWSATHNSSAAVKKLLAATAATIPGDVVEVGEVDAAPIARLLGTTPTSR
jgi:subtilisin family serine protease